MAKRASTTKNMPSLVLLVFLLVLSLLATCVLAPVTGFLAGRLLNTGSDFRIIFINTFLAILLFLCIAFRHHLRADIRDSLNLPFYKVLLHFFIGVGVAFLFTVISVGILWIFKIKGVNVSFSHISWVSVTIYIIMVSVLEVLFRGFILQSLVSEIYALPAVVLSSASFAFIMLGYGTGKQIPFGSNVDFLLGFKVLPQIFSGYGPFSSLIPILTGFFLLGALFALSYLKLSSLYAPIGMFFLLMLTDGAEIVVITNKLLKGSDIIFGTGGTILKALPGSILAWILLLLAIIGFLAIGGIFNRNEK